MAIISLAVIVHVAVGRWAPVPWLVPDLTSLVMLTVILRLPGNPAVPAAVASVAAMALAVHHPAQSGLAYLLAGGLAKWLASQWDLTQPVTERVITALGQLVVVLVLLSTIPLSPDTIGWAMLHLLITLACMPLVQLVIPRQVEER